VSQALVAGKMVFCEWPLGVDAYEAQSITDEAVRAGVPTVVGLQSRFTAGVRQAAELVRSGHLGRVVSTSIVGSGLAWRRVTDPSHAYMYDGRSGATTLTVPAAHALDALRFVLGETIRYTAAFGLSSPYVEVAGEAEALTVTAPDQIALTAERQTCGGKSTEQTATCCSPARLETATSKSAISHWPQATVPTPRSSRSNYLHPQPKSSMFRQDRR